MTSDAGSLTPAPQRRPVAVVAGGAAGIGAAVSRDLADRGAIVVVMDPGVDKVGKLTGEPAADRVVQSIKAAGGIAKASAVSITDADAVQQLFADVVLEFGSLDVVVNAAGFVRGAESGILASEDDWWATLDVHLNGYINVLSAALPVMTQAGSGRIIGFTSGGGWRPVNYGPYSGAKRAVASLTWQLGRVTPVGVTVNAVSPIADTRVRTAAKSEPVPQVPAGGLDRANLPPPEAMAPVTAYLAGELAGWLSGQILFSCGSEISVLAPPRLIEAVRTSRVDDFGRVLATLAPAKFDLAELTQKTTGSADARFTRVFDHSPRATSRKAIVSAARRAACVVVSDDAELAKTLMCVSELEARTIGIGAWLPFDPAAATVPIGFTAIAETLGRASATEGPIDSIVVALGVHDSPPVSAGARWQQVLESHQRTTAEIATQVAWLRAAAALAVGSQRPRRVVHICSATSAGTRSSSQAVTQLTRGASATAGASIAAFAVAVESADRADDRPLAALVAHLLTKDVAQLAGAEFVVRPGWVGLRTHPAPLATISFGGIEPPSWFDAAIREILHPG